MAVTAAQITSPAGQLEPALLFPADDAPSFAARCAAWIEEGSAKAAAITDDDDRDAATRDWCYYRAYEAVALRLAASPRTTTLTDQGSAGYDAAQEQTFRDLAAQHLAAFQRAVASATVDGQQPPDEPFTTPVRLQPVW